jgi:phosphatidylserine/phosphatidylglycerophosphate/cardiolipin synthase-like enzyme
MGKTQFITDSEIYRTVLLENVAFAKNLLWIATADIKDLHVKKGRRMVPFLEVLSDLLHKGVQVRLIHAREPGPAFRKDFDMYPNLADGIERLLCPRNHMKCVVVDREFAYTGSANLTGAGMGAKGPNRRNFESGIVTTDRGLVDRISEQFDSIWMGQWCEKCGRKDYCLEHRE